jgi:beta-fructofuranosidase
MALTPQPFEVGCWSGSYVVDDGGRPTILYTRVAGDDWGQGKVAVALGDPSSRYWVSTAADVVIDGPPADLGVHAFRDPYVFRHGGDWVMLMAAGLLDGSGATLQYRSSDLRNWSYDGVLCARLSSRDDSAWTGALWECPQLFPMGPDWVLLLSVWDADVLHYVAAAVGEYDGARFSPRRWQRLTYGSSAYAMSAFTDKDGRRCVLSWLREEPRNNPALTERAGAHSVAALLAIGPDGRLGLQPHPDVNARRRAPVSEGTPDEEGTSYTAGADPADAVLSVRGPSALIIAGLEGTRARISIDPRRPEVLIERPGFDHGRVPLSATGAESEVRVLVDADIVEIFAVGTYGAFRIAPAQGETTRLTLVGPQPAPGALHLL